MKTREILFKLNLRGNGIVNFDSVQQKYLLSKYGNWNENYKNDNLKFSKKSFHVSKDENGKDKLTYNLKIDSTCLRHAVFENDCKISNVKVTMNDELLAYYVSSFVGIARGYMFSVKDKLILTRSSALTICSAEEVSGALPYMEVHSNYCTDGTTKKEEKVDKKKTSLYYSENVGNVYYETMGAIDLTKLQFMSCDPQFGRVCFKDEWIEGDDSLFAKVFNEHYGKVPYEVGYFNTNTGTYKSELAEYGVKFDEEFVKYLLKNLLVRIATININRATGFANACGLQCKVVTDGFSTFDDKGWVNIENEEDIDTFIKEIEINDVYNKCD